MLEIGDDSLKKYDIIFEPAQTCIATVADPFPPLSGFVVVVAYDICRYAISVICICPP